MSPAVSGGSGRGDSSWDHARADLSTTTIAARTETGRSGDARPARQRAQEVGQKGARKRFHVLEEIEIFAICDCRFLIVADSRDPFQSAIKNQKLENALSPLSRFGLVVRTSGRDRGEYINQ
jgi:hypothetical protein